MSGKVIASTGYMEEKPFISVIVPAYNEEKTISDCLTSLVNQSYPKDRYEIIVVDNNSNDRTAEIAQKQARVLSFRQTQGVSPTRNFGFKNASGEIVASTDADSVVTEGWLEKIAQSFEEPNLVAVGGKVEPLRANFFIKFLFSVYHFFLLFNQLLGKALPWAINFAVRKSAFERIEGFNVDLKTSEDWDLALRLQRQFGSKSVKYISNLIAYTSVRKQKSAAIFLRYFWDGLVNYVNVVILGKAKAREMRVVR